MREMLVTERLTLRPPVAEDWPAARDFFMSPRSEGIGGPKSLGEAFRAFAAEIGHWEIRGYGMWTVTRTGEEGRALGLVGPWFPDDWPETEVGWMIFDPATEGTGIAHEAARAAVAHAYRVLGWKTVVSYVAHGNERSAALARRLGAVIDPAAPQPKPEKPCQVFRHPRPALQEPRHE